MGDSPLIVGGTNCARDGVKPLRITAGPCRSCSPDFRTNARVPTSALSQLSCDSNAASGIGARSYGLRNPDKPLPLSSPSCGYIARHVIINQRRRMSEDPSNAVANDRVVTVRSTETLMPITATQVLWIASRLTLSSLFNRGC